MIRKERCVTTDGRRGKLTLTEPSEYSEGMIHRERMEHARALFVRELQLLEDVRVQALLEKWGVHLVENGDKGNISTIAYPKDFPLQSRLHQALLSRVS